MTFFLRIFQISYISERRVANSTLCVENASYFMKKFNMLFCTCMLFLSSTININSVVAMETNENYSSLVKAACFNAEFINEFLNKPYDKPQITVHHEKIPETVPQIIPTPTPKPVKKEKTPKDLKEMDVPNPGVVCVSDMGYQALSCRTSAQWKLQHWTGHVKTDEKTGIRVVTDSEGIQRYCVAMGTYYGLTGTKLRIVFKSGISVNVIIGDSKSDNETDSKHQFHESGDQSIIEYITGDVSTYRNLHRQRGNLASNSSVVHIYHQGKEEKFLK